MLPNGDVLPLGIVLRAIAHLTERLGHVGVDVVTADLNATACGRLFGNDDLHGGGLTSAIMAQKAKHLAWLDREREVAHRDLLCRRLLLVLLQATTTRCRILLTVLLAQVLWEMDDYVNILVCSQVFSS